MGREASATVRALLRCLRQVSSESPRCGLGSWPAGAWGSPLCLTSRRGARRGVRSASSGWTSALVQRTDRLTRVDPDPAVPFSLSGSARSFARRMSGRGRKGSDEPSRDAPAHRVNDQITARQIRLVVDLDDRDARAAANEASNADPPSATDSDSDSSASSSTASRSTHEVLSTLVALRRARLAGLDLVEVNARADPPVCRLMRYDSFRYAQKQREREGRRAAVERRRADTVKELKLTARIGPNDVRVKADKARKFLTSGQVSAIDKQLEKLQKETGFKLRVLCQAYPETPGLAIKDYWGVDANSIVMVVDKGQKGTANILNFNVGDNLKLPLPNQFWTRLRSTFGNTFFVRENGEDVAIRRAIDTVDYCLRDELGCVDVPMTFKNPEKAMYGDQDPATKLFGDTPAKGLFDGVNDAAEKLFGA